MAKNKKKKNKIKLDILSCHEVLDRLAMVQHIIDEDICGHGAITMDPVSDGHKRLQKKCNKLMAAVYAAYRTAYEFEELHTFNMYK